MEKQLSFKDFARFKYEPTGIYKKPEYDVISSIIINNISEYTSDWILNVRCTEYQIKSIKRIRNQYKKYIKSLVRLNDILNLPEYKKIKSLGFSLVSSDLQLSRNNIVLHYNNSSWKVGIFYPYIRVDRHNIDVFEMYKKYEGYHTIDFYKYALNIIANKFALTETYYTKYVYNYIQKRKSFGIPHHFTTISNIKNIVKNVNVLLNPKINYDWYSVEIYYDRNICKSHGSFIRDDAFLFYDNITEKEYFKCIKTIKYYTASFRVKKLEALDDDVLPNLLTTINDIFYVYDLIGNKLKTDYSGRMRLFNNDKKAFEDLKEKYINIAIESIRGNKLNIKYYNDIPEITKHFKHLSKVVSFGII